LFANQVSFTLLSAIRTLMLDLRLRTDLNNKLKAAIEGPGVFSLGRRGGFNKTFGPYYEGKVIGEWGIRKWMQSDAKKSTKRTNVHIARQSLLSST
jgi:hypothetical protein